MRYIIFLILIINAFFVTSCKDECCSGGYTISFVFVDSVGNPLITNKDFKIERGTLDNGKFYPYTDNSHLVQIREVASDFSFKYPYTVIIGSFFKNENYTLFIRSQGSIIDKVHVETGDNEVFKVFFNDKIATKIKDHNVYIFHQNSSK